MRTTALLIPASWSICCEHTGTAEVYVAFKDTVRQLSDRPLTTNPSILVTGAVAGTGASIGADTGTGTEIGTGAITGTDIGTGRGTGTGPGRGTGTGAETGSGAGLGCGTGTGAETGSGPGTDTGVGGDGVKTHTRFTVSQVSDVVAS